MVIRIFVALLVLNLLAFVVQADAAERTPRYTGMSAAEAVSRVEAQVAGRHEQERSEVVSSIGLRLLTLTLTRSREEGRRYASDPARPDHGVVLLDNGACLDLKWEF